jgi:hypothetical protein
MRYAPASASATTCMRRWPTGPTATPQAMGTPDLLVIDDVGLGQVKKRADDTAVAHTLYNLIDRRDSKVAIAITSNIALSDWGPLPRRRYTHRCHPRPTRDARGASSRAGDHGPRDRGVDPGAQISTASTLTPATSR